jgi:hypothetical protein
MTLAPTYSHASRRGWWWGVGQRVAGVVLVDKARLDLIHQYEPLDTDYDEKKDSMDQHPLDTMAEC